MEWFIEDQAFSQSYALAPPPSPLPTVSSTGDTQEAEKERQLLTGEGGGGEEPNQTTARKPGSSINNSILSDALFCAAEWVTWALHLQLPVQPGVLPPQLSAQRLLPGGVHVAAHQGDGRQRLLSRHSPLCSAVCVAAHFSVVVRLGGVVLHSGLDGDAAAQFHQQ